VKEFIKIFRNVSVNNSIPKHMFMISIIFENRSCMKKKKFVNCWLGDEREKPTNTNKEIDG